MSARKSLRQSAKKKNNGTHNSDDPLDVSNFGQSHLNGDQEEANPSSTLPLPSRRGRKRNHKSESSNDPVEDPSSNVSQNSPAPSEPPKKRGKSSTQSPITPYTGKKRGRKPKIDLDPLSTGSIRTRTNSTPKPVQLQEVVPSSNTPVESVLGKRERKRNSRYPLTYNENTESEVSDSATGNRSPLKSMPEVPGHFLASLTLNGTLDENDASFESPSSNKNKRGRTSTTAARLLSTPVNEVTSMATPPATPSGCNIFASDTTSSVKRRGRPKKAAATPSTPVSSKLTNIICGVCDKEMLSNAFNTHRYSAHQGLARPKGESQEFTEEEKNYELKKTIEKVKKLSCPKCPASYTTLLGYQYHAKRCGLDKDELANMMSECTVCGKKVMGLALHMKTHEERPVTETPFIDTGNLESSPGLKPRRAASKAKSLLREISDDTKDESSKSTKKMGKMEKLFKQPTTSKITNSIIGAWKRELEKSNLAHCRYPSCTFVSDQIEELKEHHSTCEIGVKSKVFSCLKCAFHSMVRDEILQHVLESHITEEDGTFDLTAADASSSSEEESEGEEECEENEEEKTSNNEQRDNVDTERTIPHNAKGLSKAYGCQAAILRQFKSEEFFSLVPTMLATYHKKNFTWTRPLFSTWQPRTKEMTDSEGYLPVMKQSVPFGRRKFSTINLYPGSNDVEHESLTTFGAMLQQETPLFFCGGPVQSAAWCPMPPITSTARDQYLAVSIFREEHQQRSAALAPFESKYAIQIWNCGKLDSAQGASTIPVLEMSLAHEHGRMWSLAWCPSGCYDSDRLGLLAAACSDGTVRIFSVPHPSNMSPHSSGNIYEVESAIALEVNMKEKSECTALHWDKSSGHRFIVAGFANGIVGVWDLESKSPLLSIGKNRLLPIWSFYGHTSIISSVSLSPHHGSARFVATASADRSIKLWDRLDPLVPVNWSKRSRVTDIHWRHHWPGILVCVEDSCSLFRSNTVFYDFGYTGNRQPLLPQNSVVWSATENEYLDVIAHSTSAGEVILYPSHFAVIDCDDKKLRKERRVLLRTDLLDRTDGSILNWMDKSLLQNCVKKKKVVGPKLVPRQGVKAYSLIFNEATKTIVRPLSHTRKVEKTNPLSENMDVLFPCDEPVTSINKILFNPNLESHTWMCVCGENGLVQLLRINTPATAKVVECYLKELNKVHS